MAQDVKLSPAVGVVAAHWRLMARDRTALVFVLALPVMITWVLGTIYVAQDDDRPARVGLVAEGRGPVSDLVIDRLAGSGVVEIERFADRTELERAVRRSAVAAGVVVPAALDQPHSGAEVDLIGPPGVAAPDGPRGVVETVVADVGTTLQLGYALAPEDPFGQGLDAALAHLDPPGARTSVQEATGAHAGATIATLVLFVFMNTMAMSSVVPAQRILGILARLGASPASLATVAAGQGLALASIAALQAAVVLACGSVLFGISWGDPLALATVVALIAVAAGGLGLMVGTVLPSVESGTSIAGPAGFALGMLGGCLWPLDIVGPTLRGLGHLTPHAWAVKALDEVVAGGAASATLVPLAVLAVTAGVSMAIGGWRMSRLVTKPV